MSAARVLPRFGNQRRGRIGLLGGSFNPAHEGHLYIAQQAIKKLRLDGVWLLVSPQNPLKSRVGMERLEDRLASARKLTKGGLGAKITATDLERHFPSTYTLSTIRRLKTLFPFVNFVWLMGADNLKGFDRWYGWRKIAASVPVAIFARAPYSQGALNAKAAKVLSSAKLPARRAGELAQVRAPAWVFLHVKTHPQSSTALRALKNRSRP